MRKQSKCQFEIDLVMYRRPRSRSRQRFKGSKVLLLAQRAYTQRQKISYVYKTILGKSYEMCAQGSPTRCAHRRASLVSCPAVIRQARKITSSCIAPYFSGGSLKNSGMLEPLIRLLV